jgi:hypothetical protein
MMQSNDNQVPPPQPSGPGETPVTAPAQPTPSVQLGPVRIGPVSQSGLGGNDVIIGVGISLVLAIVAWFVGRILTDTLVKQFAEVGSAKRAGLMLFLLLTDLATFATFGFLGNYWVTTYFLAAGGSLTFILLCVFIFSLVSANRTKRR